MFKRAHTLFIDNAQTTTDLIQAECGKNRRMAIEETCDPVMVMSHYLKRAPKLLAPVKRGGPVPMVSTSTEIRQPKGVIGIIAPWNFPFATGHLRRDPGADGRQRHRAQARQQDRAVAAVRHVSCWRRPGLPKGLFQVVCGEGPDVGPTLIDNANYVMFTGSTATGRVIGERAGRNLIGCLPRARRQEPDDRAATTPTSTRSCRARMFGAFGNTGQICMHIERMYLPASQYDDFKGRFVAATEALDARRVVRLRAGRRLAGLARPQGPGAVARRGRGRQGRDGR